MERDVGQVANAGRGRDSSRRQYRNVAASIDAKLALGERAVAFLRADRGDVIADTWLRGGDDRKLPLDLYGRSSKKRWVCSTWVRERC